MTKSLALSFELTGTILWIIVFFVFVVPAVGQTTDSSTALRIELLKNILKDDTLLVEGETGIKPYKSRAFIRHRYQSETAQFYIVSKYFSDSSLMSHSKQIFAFGGALYTASNLVSEDAVKKILADNVGFTPKHVEKYAKKITSLAKSRLVKSSGTFLMGFGVVASIANGWREMQEMQDTQSNFPKIPSFGNEELLVMVLDLRQEPFVNGKVLLLDLIDHSLTSNINEDDLNASVTRIDSILSSDSDLRRARIFQRSKWIASNIDTVPLPTLSKYVLKEPSTSGANAIPIFVFALIGGAALVLAYFVLVRKGILK